ALVFGGDGHDTVRAGGGPVVFVGGAGRDRLEGGLAPAILIGGAGDDEIKGRSGADLLIGCKTNFDANLTALRAILAEWSRTDIDCGTKVAPLTGATAGGTNAPYFFTSKTLIDDDAVDGLEGTASGGNLWVARISPARHDRISGFTSGETILVP